jgi:hypothetical protein
MSPSYFENANINMLKAYDYFKVKEAFDYITNISDIQFGFPQGGCQQRAHIMSVILSRMFNIEHCKVWLFSPAALNLFDNRTLSIADPNGLTENNSIEWNFHVVPVIRTGTGSAAELMVTDPSLQKLKALTLNEWFMNINNSNMSKYTFVLPDKYFFNCSYIDNSLTSVFDGSFFDFDELVKDDLTMEKGLALNDMSITIYHKYIQPLQKHFNTNEIQKLEDLTAIFGNATAVDLLFSQNRSGNTINTMHRYVLTNYGDIIEEARNLFYERLVYWTNYTNELFMNKT